MSWDASPEAFANVMTLRRRPNVGPAISVVMPTCQRAHQIGASVESLLCGHWRDFELLVRDDGNGGDGTREAIERAAQGDSRVQYTRNAISLGMPENLNSGIHDTQGAYIVVCHDHDIYAADYLSALLDTLRSHPSAGFAHCAIEMMTQQGEVKATHIGPWAGLTKGSEWLEVMLKGLSCPVCALTMVPRAMYEQHGLYNPAFGFVSDVEMWMRLAACSDVSYVSRPLIKVRERESEHIATARAIEIARTIVRIHRKYLPVKYRGWRKLHKRARLEATYGVLVAKTAIRHVIPRGIL